MRTKHILTATYKEEEEGEEEGEEAKLLQHKRMSKLPIPKVTLSYVFGIKKTPMGQEQQK